MSLLNQSTKGKVRLPPITIYYSGAGLGKSTLGDSYPKPCFIDFEQGSYEFDVERHEPDSWATMMAILKEVSLAAPGTLSFESLVVDTLDAVEVLMHIQLAKDNNKENIEDIGWQKGFLIALEYWAEFVKIIKVIRKRHNMPILLLSHAADIKKEDMQLGAKYSRYGMNINFRARDYLFSQVDMVLFGKRDVALKKKKDSEVRIAIDQDAILAHTRLSCHWDAKNRYGLPETIVMPTSDGYAMLKGYIDAAQNETPEIVYQECLAAITRVIDPALNKQMTDYVNKNKNDLNVLRATLERILSNVNKETGE